MPQNEPDADPIYGTRTPRFRPMCGGQGLMFWTFDLHVSANMLSRYSRKKKQQASLRQIF
jgi:hypothetical protein